MASQDFLPTDVTPQEQAAGFSLQTIDNPFHAAGQPLKVRAVICTLSPSRRIVKLILPGDRIGYQLHRYGRYFFTPPTSRSEWLLDLDFSIPDPSVAIQYFQSDLARMLGHKDRIIETLEGPK